MQKAGSLRLRPFGKNRSNRYLKIKYYLAIDIGASSGRHIIGWQENGAIQTDEVYRFPNGVEERDGHLVGI